MIVRHSCLLLGVRKRRLRSRTFYSSAAPACLSRAVMRAQILHELRKCLKLVPAGIRDGAVLKIAALPEEEVITVAGCAAGQMAVVGDPAEHVDDMRAVLVDDNRRA